MHALGRRTIAVGATGGLALALLTGTVFGADPSTSHAWPYASSGSVPVLAAVGDISCEPDDPGNASNPTAVKCDGAGIGGYSAQYATADQIEGLRPDLVAL